MPGGMTPLYTAARRCSLEQAIQVKGKNNILVVGEENLLRIRNGCWLGGRVLEGCSRSFNQAVFVECGIKNFYQHSIPVHKDCSAFWKATDREEHTGMTDNEADEEEESVEEEDEEGLD